MSFFITFEGIEGSGKTTQMLLLKKHLQGLGFDVVTTREPGGCRISDAIRSLVLDPDNTNMTPQTELLLYAASRAQHIAEVIHPSLQEGKIVLCDRFSDATSVYQGAGRGLDTSVLETINTISAGNLTPDLTLLLDFSVEAGLKRALARNKTDELTKEGRFELEEVSFHQRIRQGYLDLARTTERFRTIDAEGATHEVAQRITASVDDFIAEQRTA